VKLGASVLFWNHGRPKRHNLRKSGSDELLFTIKLIRWAVFRNSAGRAVAVRSESPVAAASTEVRKLLRNRSSLAVVSVNEVSAKLRAASSGCGIVLATGHTFAGIGANKEGCSEEGEAAEKHDGNQSLDWLKMILWIDCERMSRKKRMAELSSITTASVYNQVYHLQKPDYSRDVTEASKNAYVLVLLTSSTGTNTESRIMIEHWRELAKRFGDVKFCQMRADLCIEGYPDKNTPTILIYKDGDIKRQIVTLMQLAGPRTSVQGE
jgi:hypothetical protein